MKLVCQSICEALRQGSFSFSEPYGDGSFALCEDFSLSAAPGQLKERKRNFPSLTKIKFNHDIYSFSDLLP